MSCNKPGTEKGTVIGHWACQSSEPRGHRIPRERQRAPWPLSEFGRRQTGPDPHPAPSSPRQVLAYAQKGKTLEVVG